MSWLPAIDYDSFYKLRISIDSLHQALSELNYKGEMEWVFCTNDKSLDYTQFESSRISLTFLLPNNFAHLVGSSQGTYLLMVEPDIVYSAPQIRLLTDIVEGKYQELVNTPASIFVVPHHLLKPHQEQILPELSTWLQQIAFCGNRLPRYYLTIGAKGHHATLAHRDLWQTFADNSDDLSCPLRTSPFKFIKFFRSKNAVVDTRSLSLTLHRLNWQLRSSPTLYNFLSLTDFTNLTDMQHQYLMEVNRTFQNICSTQQEKYGPGYLSDIYINDFRILCPLIWRLNQVHTFSSCLIISPSPTATAVCAALISNIQLIWICPPDVQVPLLTLYSTGTCLLIATYFKSTYEGRIINREAASGLYYLNNMGPYPEKFDLCYLEINQSYLECGNPALAYLQKQIHSNTIIIAKLIDNVPSSCLHSLFGTFWNNENTFNIGGFFVLYPFHSYLDKK
jgi:hypothetical protein